MRKTWFLRLVTVLLWALAAASAVYWTLRMGTPGTTAQALPAAGPGLALDDPSQQARLARLLGASGAAAVAAAPAVAERFALTGVVAGQAGQGAALISVDGQPARPFVVGMQIVSGYVLKAVGRREALLAEDVHAPAAVILTLPVPGQSPAAEAAVRAPPHAPGPETAATPPAPVPLVAAPVAVPSPTPLSTPPAPVTGVSPEGVQAGPPPRADVRRQGLPSSR